MSSISRDEVRALASEIVGQFPGAEVVLRIGEGVRRLSVAESKATSTAAASSCLLKIKEEDEASFLEAVKLALEDTGKGDLKASFGPA